MNYIFSFEILRFPINFLVFANFIFGIYFFSKFIIKVKLLKLNFINLFLFQFVIFGSYIAFTNYLLFLDVKLTKFFVYISYFLFFLLNVKNLKKNIKKFSWFKLIDLNAKIIICFLLIYFIFSSLPLSDGDSLSYHSAFGAYTIRFNSLNWLSMSHLIHPDFLVSGFTEILNLIGLILYNENFGSFLNFTSLIYIIYFFYNFTNPYHNTNFIILIIIASPILLPMVFSQKIYILPSFLLAVIFFKIYKNNKFQIYDEILIISSLMLVLSFKVSFLYSVLTAILYLVYKNKKNFFRIVIFCFSISIFFFGPIIFKNIVFHNDLLPPFTGQILGTNSEYLNLAADFLKSYDISLNLKNLIILPFLFLAPHYGQGGFVYLSLPNVGKVFGIQFYNFFFTNQYFKFELKVLLIIIFLSVILTGNISTRWFLFLFFLIQILICDSKFNINKIFRILFYFQTTIFLFFLVCYSIYSIPSLFFEKYRENYLRKHANGYDFIKKINNIVIKNNFSSNEKILFSHRSHYWTNHKNDHHLNYANEWLKLININKNVLNLNTQFMRLLRNEKIKILVIRQNKDIKTILSKSFKKKCIISFNQFSANHATRNPFFSGTKNYNWIIFKNYDLIECLK